MPLNWPAAAKLGHYRRAERFIDADCRRHETYRVSFTGTVAGLDGLGDLYRVVLVGNRHGRQWQALVPRAEWLRYSSGDWIILSGVLTLHDVDGELFATIRVGAKVLVDH